MDRLIAPNSVDAAHADTAPASGTPGFATDGNPATGVPATLWPAYAWNAVQEELIAVIAAAGITPSKATNTQVRDAIKAMRGNLNGNVAVNGPLTITASQAGTVFDYFGGGGDTIKLPAVSSVAAASGFYINALSGPLTVTVAGGGDAFAFGGSHSGTTSFVMQVGDSIALYSASDGTHWLPSGSGVFQFNPITVAPAVASNQAVQLGQAIQRFSGIIGTATDLRGSSAGGVASSTATWAFTENIAEDSSGNTYKIGPLTGACNLATVGLNGMDVGPPPLNASVGVYALWNTTTGANGIVAQSAISGVLPARYSGANLPAGGFNASVLIGVMNTDATGKFFAFTQVGRKAGIASTIIISTSTSNSGATFISAGIPLNAKYISGNLSITNTAASTMQLNVFDSDSVTGGKFNLQTLAAGATSIVPFEKASLLTPQQVRWSGSSTAGTPAYQITLTSFEF